MIKNSASSSRIFPSIIVFLLVIIVGMLAFIVYKEIIRDIKETTRYPNTKTDVLRIYGDFFKTPEEQKALESNTSLYDTIKVDFKSIINDTYYRKFCRNVSGGNYLQRRRKRQVDMNQNDGPHVGNSHLTYHGCCTSFRKFISPSAAYNDHSNREVELVHFGNEERQYFLVDICWQDIHCDLGCGCRKQVGLFRALVYNPDFHPDSDSDGPRYLVQTVRLGGSCKCMNNLSPTAWVHR